MMKYYILLFILPVISYSCVQPGVDEDSQTIKYFPLDSFVQAEIQRLTDANTKVIKKVSYDDSADKVNLDSVNFKELLQPLLDCNIHKPNLVGSYDIDTTYIKDTLKVSYTANTDKLKLRSLMIYFMDGEVKKIHSAEVKKGFFSSFNQNLKYLPVEGLFIEKEYNTTFTASTNISFIAHYIN